MILTTISDYLLLFDVCAMLKAKCTKRYAIFFIRSVENYSVRNR